MKIVINKTGKIEEVSEKVASRLINKGKAHFIKESVALVNELAKEVEIVTEIDLIEPIPERFTSFEEPKKPKKKLADISDEIFEVPKPKRKNRKKKSKFES